MRRKNGAGPLIGGLVAGLVAGAAAALLLAPKAGRETRDMLKDRGGRYIGAIKERIRRNKNQDE
jgi:gas vesicle protein